MAKICVFCGSELGFLDRDAVSCGGVIQPACKDCSTSINCLSVIERCQRALDSGRAVEEEKVRAALEQARLSFEMERQSQMAGKTCLRCGGQMLRQGVHTFKLGEETFFFSDFNRLASGAMELALIRCESCGKIEFFDPDFLK